MGKRKLSAEERHIKQKAKLEEKPSAENIYIPQKYFKSEVVDRAQKQGFKCILDRNSVIMFSSKEDTERVEKWLFDNFSKEEETFGKKLMRIPFSYGFGKVDAIQPSAEAVEAGEE